MALGQAALGRWFRRANDFVDRHPRVFGAVILAACVLLILLTISNAVANRAQDREIRRLVEQGVQAHDWGCDQQRSLERQIVQTKALIARAQRGEKITIVGIEIKDNQAFITEASAAVARQQISLHSLRRNLECEPEKKPGRGRPADRRTR